MQSLDIALKGIKAVFIYNMLREGVPKSNGTWGKRIQVVTTSGVRDRVAQGILLSSDCSSFVYSIQPLLGLTQEFVRCAMLKVHADESEVRRTIDLKTCD